MITVEFTPDEMLALRNLLDAAVRSLGMRGAEAALVLDRKLLAAAKAWEVQQPPINKLGNGDATTQRAD